jgi:hypothetical protein
MQPKQLLLTQHVNSKQQLLPAHTRHPHPDRLPLDAGIKLYLAQHQLQASTACASLFITCEP